MSAQSAIPQTFKTGNYSFLSRLAPAWFALFAGGILAFDGIEHVLDSAEKLQVFELPDPVFALPFRFLLLLIGVFELFIAWLCLFSKKRAFAFKLLTWLAANFIAYRIGLWILGWRHPWIFVGRLTEGLNTSPIFADDILFLICLYLLFGRWISLWREHQTAHAVGFQKTSCSSCGGHIKFAIENLGQKIDCPHCKTGTILRNPHEILKMSCFFCKEHIEFSAHSLGRKIKCPHCNMEIGLKENA
jgi:DNA-directed RNA polymerase subunit RPC12/RpoP